MKVHVNQITIPNNYVLILPDHDFKHFQFNGEDSLLVGEKDAETSATHFSVRGQVFGLPERLRFFGPLIRQNKLKPPIGMPQEQILFYFRSQVVENMGYKKGSVLFNVPMEVKLHDIAYFNYQEQYSCYEEARTVDTIEHGTMLLIKYDNLICCHPEHNEEAVTMLNGYILTEPISVKTVFGEHIYKKAGLLIADMRKEHHNVKEKTMLGHVVHFGSHVQEYLENYEHNEGHHDFSEGDIILYNPKVAPPLNFSLHKNSFKGKELLKIHRRDIFCILPAAFNDKLPEMATNMHLN